MYKDPGPETERNHRSVCAPKVSWTERQKGWNDLSYPYLVLDGVAFRSIVSIWRVYRRDMDPCL